MPVCENISEKARIHAEKTASIQKMFNRNQVIKDAYNISDLNHAGKPESFANHIFGEIFEKATGKIYSPDYYEDITDFDYYKVQKAVEKHIDLVKSGKYTPFGSAFLTTRTVAGKTPQGRIFNRTIEQAFAYEKSTRHLVDSASDKMLDAFKRSFGVSKEAVESGMKTFSLIDEYEMEALKADLEGDENKANSARAKLEELIKTEEGKRIQSFIYLMENYKRSELKNLQHKTDSDGSSYFVDKQGYKSTYNSALVEAASEAKEILHKLGGVNKIALSKLSSNIDLIVHGFEGKLNKNIEISNRVTSIKEKINEQIKMIDQSMNEDNYFPHYHYATFSQINDLVDKIGKSKSDEDYKSSLGELDKILSNFTPTSTKGRSQGSEAVYKNPINVIRRYGQDAIFFNKKQHVEGAFYELLKTMPYDADPRAMNSLIDFMREKSDLAVNGYKSRDAWVNRLVFYSSGLQFVKTLGLSISSPMTNIMGSWTVAADLGFKNVKKARKILNGGTYNGRSLQDIINANESGIINIFEERFDTALYEGVFKNYQGVTPNDLEIVINENGKPTIAVKNGKLDETLRQGLEKAIVATGFLQRWSEKFIRKTAFETVFAFEYDRLYKTEWGKKDAKRLERKAAERALEFVNATMGEYSPYQRAKVLGGSTSNVAASGQVFGGFLHFASTFGERFTKRLLDTTDEIGYLFSDRDQFWSGNAKSDKELFAITKAQMYASPESGVRFAVAMSVWFILQELLEEQTGYEISRFIPVDTIERVTKAAKTVAAVAENPGDVDAQKRANYNKGLASVMTGPLFDDMMFIGQATGLLKTQGNQLGELILGVHDANEYTDEQINRQIFRRLSSSMYKAWNMTVGEESEAIYRKDPGLKFLELLGLGATPESKEKYEKAHQYEIFMERKARLQKAKMKREQEKRARSARLNKELIEQFM